MNFEWIKKGVIYATSGDFEWSKTHTTLPTPLIVDDRTLRIYYSSRDKDQKSRISYIEVDIDNFSHIKYIHRSPVMSLGKLGNHDDVGHTSSFFLKHQNGKDVYYYFNGYNIARPARYRIAIGMAQVLDQGKYFKKISDGPIMDRSIVDPCGVATPFILFENGKYRMWYASFIKWEYIHDDAEPFYCIKYATSEDAINWKPEDITCIGLANDEGGIVRPSVMKINNKFYMWYSVRKNTGYRERIDSSYRIGFAESNDGIHWIRRDKDAGIDLSEEGWDSEMICYPYVFECQNKVMMLYNGNGFGQSGFGYAELKQI
jgi:hypothetical protein